MMNQENFEPKNEEVKIENIPTTENFEEEPKKEKTKKSNFVTAFSGMGKLPMQKKHLGLFLIIIILIVITIILSVVSKNVPQKENNVGTEKPKVEENVQKKALKELKKLDIFEYDGTSHYGYFYENNIDLNTIGSKEKIEIALYQITKTLDVTHPMILTKDQVQKKIDELFPNTNTGHQTASTRCMTFTFENDHYYGNPGECSVSSDRIVKEITKVEEKDDEVLIHQKVAVLTTNKNGKIDLYTTLKKEKNDFVETLNIKDYNEFMLEKYMDFLYTYTFTFKKGDNENYLFQKVERIEDCKIAKTC